MSSYRPDRVKIIADRENLERIGKLRQFIETIAAEYKRGGVPIGSDGRIDMSAFVGIYPDVDKDQDGVRRRFRDWYGGFSDKEAQEQRLLSDGEKLEMLIYVILHKNLGSEFVVARSSEHDDHIHGVDQLLLERTTGNIICAFDEVGDTTGANYEKKAAVVQDHNVHRGGATIKYGLKLEDEGGARRKSSPQKLETFRFFTWLCQKTALKKA